MLNVGLIGIGFMGWIHYLAYQRSSRARVAAICTRDPKKAAGDWTGIRGNFGPPGEQVDLSGVRVEPDWRRLIEDRAIDAVDICLPPAMHREVAVAALRAGKHVLCEKPIALNTADAAEMVAAAEQAGRVLSVAHVLPFLGAFRHAAGAIRRGELGAVRSMHLKRIISDPTWIPDFYNPATIGGPMIDLHIHDAHYILLLLGRPRSVTAAGWRRGEVTQYAHAMYHFESRGVAVTAASGVACVASRGFTHGFEIQCEKAILGYEFAAGEGGIRELPLTEYPAAEPMRTVDLPPADDVDAFVAEIDGFVRQIDGNTGSGEAESPLQARFARDAVAMCAAVDNAVATGREVEISY